MKKLALVSVYDKSGLENFVKELVKLEFEILSTGNTARFIEELGYKVTKVSDFTGQNEILDGRVKTLHPKIHAGLLARRDRPKDMEQLKLAGFSSIDLLVVNLYPFLKKIAEGRANLNSGEKDFSKLSAEELIEFIDIGGPTMLRAAGKNFQNTLAVSDVADYEQVTGYLKTGSVPLGYRAYLAAKVFTTMSVYDGAVANFLTKLSQDIKGETLDNLDIDSSIFAAIEPLVLKQNFSLRYGENPHQQAAVYQRYTTEPAKQKLWEQLQGKELSFNNLLDTQAAIELSVELFDPSLKENFAVVIKHSNPCGAAIRQNNLEAFIAARDCDPLSSFGGIISVSGMVDGELAEAICEQFVEIVILEQLTESAKEKFAAKKNLRIIQTKFADLRNYYQSNGYSIRSFLDQILLQSWDNRLVELDASQVVTVAKPTPELLRDAQFAWKICKHVKSNAIIIAKENRSIGVGAGQMSRVDAAKLSISRANNHGHVITGSAAASDAFLPFADTLEILQQAGVKCLVQPGGSIKDEDVIKVADKLGVVMFFTGERHFKH